MNMNETMRARLLKRAVVGGLLCLAAFAAAADEEATASVLRTYQIPADRR